MLFFTHRSGNQTTPQTPAFRPFYSLVLSTTLVGSLALLGPCFARGHSRHLRSEHHPSHPAAASQTGPLPIAVASRYAHGAALSLAHRVNDARARVAAQALARHEQRMRAHEAHLAAQQAQHARRLALRRQHEKARLAARQQHARLHAAKLARQHKALTSGNVVMAAASLRGTRYVMGGTSRSGFDCSGFVRYILGHTGGVSLPRTATEQYYHGTPIPLDKLQPGDLVFFKNTYKHGISHVGIYAGHGKFIHAANAHKGVREDSLNSSYYWKHYAGARRVLPEQMRQAALEH